MTALCQLLREWPPGHGGVERVAHELAEQLGGTVYSLLPPSGCPDPLPVSYIRRHLPGWCLGRLVLPWPAPSLWSVLLARDPLVVHLPCPTVLLLALLARAVRPARSISVYWHAFLEPQPGPVGHLQALYQWVALRALCTFPVLTTSPVLQAALQAEGLPAAHLACLPCALPSQAEAVADSIWVQRAQSWQPTGRVISIGRLDSYKRIDWMLQAAATTPEVLRIDVVGEGPDRRRLEALARQLLLPHQRAHFHGRVSEQRKFQLLAEADLLVLPADRCNEAFGLVQLEAMACGVPALAFDLPRSGMHWVSHVAGVPWSGDSLELAAVLQRLFAEPARHRQVCVEARGRYIQEFGRGVWCERLSALALHRAQGRVGRVGA